jgi:hypothetical protein
VPLAFAGSVVLFLTTRLALLDRFPPFLDESLYASWTQQGYEAADQRFVALANGKEPLQAWLGMLVMKLGAGPLTAIRLVSIACGLGTLVVVSLLATRCAGRVAGAAAAIAYAILPFFVVHDSIGLMEPLVTVLLFTSLYLQVRLAESPRLDLALLLGLAMGGALLTKKTGELAIVLAPLSALVLDWSPEQRIRRVAGWVGWLVLAIAVAFACFSILKLSGLYAAYRSTQGQYHSAASAFGHPLRWLDANWPSDRTDLLGFATWPLVLAAAAGLGLTIRMRTRMGLLIGGWFIAALASCVLFAVEPFARYLSVAIAFVPLLIGCLVGFAASALGTIAARERWGNFVVAAVVLLACVPALRFDGQIVSDPNRARYPGITDQEYATGWPAGNAWVAVAHELERRVRSAPAVVAMYNQFSPALQLVLQHHRNIDVERGDSDFISGPAAVKSLYVIENGIALPHPYGVGVLREVWDYPRPRNGVDLKLFERGVVANGRFYTSPDGLRAGLGLPDKAFDGFVASHPAIRQWYDAEAGP